MFGIGGGELVFIMFIVLMLFGSDKVPEMARTMGKAMAQLKNATNDIKSEIQKGAEVNGFDQKTMNVLTGNFNSEINKVKDSLLGDTTTTVNDISQTFSTEIEKTKESITKGPSTSEETSPIEESTGPVKRQM
jgi:sec-independent protein translocase protein TatA